MGFSILLKSPKACIWLQCLKEAPYTGERTQDGQKIPGDLSQSHLRLASSLNCLKRAPCVGERAPDGQNLPGDVNLGIGERAQDGQNMPGDLNLGRVIK